MSKIVFRNGAYECEGRIFKTESEARDWVEIRRMKQYDKWYDEQMTEEEKLREEHPGLKDLWNQYQTMLKLCKSAKPEPKEETVGDILANIRARQAKKSSQKHMNKCAEVEKPSNDMTKDLLASIRSKQ